MRIKRKEKKKSYVIHGDPTPFECLVKIPEITEKDVDKMTEEWLKKLKINT